MIEFITNTLLEYVMLINKITLCTQNINLSSSTIIVHIRTASTRIDHVSIDDDTELHHCSLAALYRIDVLKTHVAADSTEPHMTQSQHKILPVQNTPS